MTARIGRMLPALGFILGCLPAATAQTLCQANAGVPPIVREESFADLVGDLVIDCTSPPNSQTPPGQFVPQVNVTVTLSTNITSRILSSQAISSFSEALLIVDEPNSPRNPNTPLLACGSPGAPDIGPSGRGVCSIKAPVDARQTYNGVPSSNGILAPCAIAAYACGRPNVFQGRQGNGPNVIIFTGVPFDPPGIGIDDLKPLHRFLRITNIRANVPGASASGLLQTIVMNVNINGASAFAINNPTHVVAAVQRGITGPTLSTNALAQPDGVTILSNGQLSFAQCISVGQGTNDPARTRVRFREGFPTSFKPKSVEHLESNSTAHNLGGSITTYLQGQANYPVPGIRQNIPGLVFNTESGFTSNPTDVNATQETLFGITTRLSVAGTPITNATGIENAGMATQGTRVVLLLQSVPRGVRIEIPTTVNLVQAGTNSITGVARRVDAVTERGDGDFTYVIPSPQAPTPIMYEVLYANPSTLEDLEFELNITYASNTLSDLPEVDKPARVTGGFAPYQLQTDATAFWSTAQIGSHTVSNNTLPVPRFRNHAAVPLEIFRVNRCMCNLLFPFVTNAPSATSNWDTGIALANTSLTPGASTDANRRFGFANGTPQQGPVQFWYYPANATDPAVPTQCTNASNTGVCPGTTPVLPGETLLFSISQGSNRWGLKPSPGFTGYVIAQAHFQYCHAFAFIGPQGAPVLTNGQSVGYLALQMDGGINLRRTTQSGESLQQ
jgi:hypothetical protein